MASKNERVELEMKIVKYRRHAVLSAVDEVTRKRIASLIANWKRKSAR